MTYVKRQRTRFSPGNRKESQLKTSNERKSAMKQNDMLDPIPPIPPFLLRLILLILKIRGYEPKRK